MCILPQTVMQCSGPVISTRFLVQRGSVVLVRYPFTDLSTTKVRPAVVVTSNLLLSQMEDILCLFISSVMPGELLPTDFVLEPSHPAFPATGLRLRSVFRTHKLALLHQGLVLRKFGDLEEPLMREIDSRLQIALGLPINP